MAPIEPSGITGEEATHDGGEGDPPRKHQQVHVVGHQNPRAAGGRRLFQDPAQSPEKPRPISLIPKVIDPRSIPLSMKCRNVPGASLRA